MSVAPLLLTIPILERMRAVEGWLTDEEADVLIAGASLALAEHPAPHHLVEIGSYCGRSTSVIGSVVKALSPGGVVHAVDPHEGEVGAERVVQTAPTLERFRRTIADAELEDVVRLVRLRSYEVVWEEPPIAFLLVDGLHDYANVSRDYQHFEPHLAPGALVAFHDYADYYPGVRAFVDELQEAGRCTFVALAHSMVLLRRASP